MQECGGRGCIETSFGPLSVSTGICTGLVEWPIAPFHSAQISDHKNGCTMLVSFISDDSFFYYGQSLDVFCCLVAGLCEVECIFPCVSGTFPLQRYLADAQTDSRHLWGRSPHVGQVDFQPWNGTLQLKVYFPKARFLCHNCETAEQIMAPQMQSKLASLLLQPQCWHCFQPFANFCLGFCSLWQRLSICDNRVWIH